MSLLNIIQLFIKKSINLIIFIFRFNLNIFKIIKSTFKYLFYLTLFIIIIIIFGYISYYYYFKYQLNNFIKFKNKVIELQGYDKIKKDQNILRKFIFKKQNYNKRYILKNFIDKKQLNFFKFIIKFYSKYMYYNNNNQLHLNLINLYGIKPSNNHILILNKIINRIRLKIELIYNLNLKLDYYVFTKNRKNAFDYPYSDCKSFDSINKKFINNACPNRHFVVYIMLNNNYKGGEFKFCNNNIPIKLKQTDFLIFDGNEVHETNPILNGNQHILTIWFKKKNLLQYIL